jgi:hypothetical protein
LTSVYQLDPRPEAVLQHCVLIYMENIAVPNVFSIVQSTQGFIITFSDGKKGLYPDVLLYSILELTDPVDGQDHRIDNHHFELPKAKSSA